MILLRQMLVFFLIILVGYICRKIGFLNDTASKSISAIVVNVANPMLILSSAMSGERISDNRVLLHALLSALLIHTVMILASRFLPRLLGAKPENYGIYRVMLIFSNIGFVGMPVIRATYGEIAVLYAAVFTVPYNILIYTYGISEIKGEKFDFRGNSTEVLKKIFNVGVISAIIGIAIYLLGIQTPSFIKETVDYLSNLTAPLSMMVIGNSLAKMDVRKLFTNKELLIFSAVKLLILPIICTFIVLAVPIDPTLKGVCMIMMAVPVGSMTAMMAQQYDSNYELASQGVALTTLLSVLTIPVVSLVTGI
ncbi:MAG: AEC family transporter [Lachnospiraceae bacterium]|nr:AEC family transporter [Lachnospiraceae bacterium]